MASELSTERPQAYQSGTLGQAIEAFLQQQAEGASYQRGLENWYRILRLGANMAIFERSLTGYQQKALQVIGEWWEDKFSTRQRGERIAELFIFARSCVTTKMHGFDPSKQRSFFDRDIEAPLYHNALQQLFVLEFIVEEGWKKEKTKDGVEVGNWEGFAQSLYDARSKAVMFASAQRLVWHYTRDLQIRELSSPSLFNHDIPAWIDTSPWLRPDEKIGLPFYLWDCKNEVTVETSKIKDPNPKYICISHTWGRWRKQSKVRLKGVPWLIPENTRFDVSALPQLLKDAEIGLDYIWLDLLCIPQDDSAIAKSEISRQICIFGSSIPCAIWFGPDIPSWELINRSLAWLCLDYLQSTGWEAGIRVDDETLAIKHRSHQNPIKSPEFMMALGRQAHPPTGIYRMERNADGTENWRLPSWFTSLWTLQEICLRPSMFLLDEKMRLFRARDQKLIMFDQLMAFLRIARDAHEPSNHLNTFLYDYGIVQGWALDKFEQARNLLYAIRTRRNSPEEQSKRQKELPYGSAELLELGREMTTVQDVAREPISILWLADGRECKRSRAIAIMSVLGATKWYNECVQETSADGVYAEDEKFLVLGKYPVAFLQEVANRFGAFFYSFGLVRTSISNPWSHLVPGMSPVGSLLPFSKNSDNSHGFSPFPPLLSADLQHGTTHPSVKTWSIQQDGTVHIQSAAILATQHDLIQGRKYDIWFNIYVWSILFDQEPTQPRRALNFPDLLPMLPPGQDSIFVVTIEGNTHSSGILLHRISEGEMVKVGTWYTANTSLWNKNKSLASEKVNWKVL